MRADYNARSAAGERQPWLLNWRRIHGNAGMSTLLITMPTFVERSATIRGRRASRGLPSRRFLFMAYLVCSLLAAFGGLMLTARAGSGRPNLGGSLMLESIAAAVIGGDGHRAVSAASASSSVPCS